MSLELNELVRLVKRAAVDAVEAGSPMQVCFGVVSSVSPLTITVDQKKILHEAQLILTNAVRDFSVDMTVNHETEDAEGGDDIYAYAAHRHAYLGRKTFRVHLGLTPGERVILLRCNGGQKFIVLDRWEAPGL